MMTVGQLRDTLKDLPDEALIVLSFDEIWAVLDIARILPVAGDEPQVLVLGIDGYLVNNQHDLDTRLDEAVAPFLGHCP
jgi:hypothetical protein